MGIIFSYCRRPRTWKYEFTYTRPKANYIEMYINNFEKLSKLKAYGFSDLQIEEINDKLQSNPYLIAALNHDYTAEIFLPIEQLYEMNEDLLPVSETKDLQELKMELYNEQSEEPGNQENQDGKIVQEQVEQGSQDNLDEGSQGRLDDTPLVIITSIILNDAKRTNITHLYNQECKTVGDLLSNVNTTAKYLVCNLTVDNVKISVPFSTRHLNDAFPFEHVPNLEKCFENMTLLQQTDKFVVSVPELDNYSFELFKCGFSKFRPWAWGWLSGYSKDPDAMLVLTRNNESEIAYLPVYDPCEPEWIQSPKMK